MIEEYSLDWPKRFEEERRLLEAKLGNLASDIQHIGSTAVPGLKAKPIIDLMVAVPSLKEAGSVRNILEGYGYTYEPGMSSTERLFFRKGNPIEFHLSVAQQDHTSYWERQILFRDYLRTHHDARSAYERIKKEAAELDPSGGKVYSAHKSEFVEKSLRDAGVSGSQRI